MSHNTHNFWIDLGLFALLGITILAATVEIFIPCFVHVALGLTLSGAVLIHIALHWRWITNAFRRFAHLPAQARTNFVLNLALLVAYTAAGVMGLISRSFIFMGPVRHFLGFFHVLLVLGALFLQSIHLLRHWKWVSVTARKVLAGSGA